jgi:hypothetical protein
LIAKAGKLENWICGMWSTTLIAFVILIWKLALNEFSEGCNPINLIVKQASSYLRFINSKRTQANKPLLTYPLLIPNVLKPISLF